MKVDEQDQRTVDVLLRRHGRTMCDQLGIPIARGTPSPLFRLLVASILASAPIGHEVALDAARAIHEAGWTTAAALRSAGWSARVQVLNRSGYARYDESASRKLGDTCEIVLDLYGGDLRNLREAAERKVARERALLKEFKGIGDVGAGVFLREAQVAWPELHPFLDRKAAGAARRLGLPGAAADLAVFAEGPPAFARLAGALVTASLEKTIDDVLEEARQ